MKFKVGDKVRVRKNLVAGEVYNGLTFWEGQMERTRGRVLKVNNLDTNCYRIYDDEADTFWYMTEAMLEPVEEEKENEMEKIVIIRDGNKVTAKYYKGDKTVSAEAKCSPEDEFNFEIGAKLAMDRAIEKMEEETEYSLVKCVGYRQKDEFFFTIDKVYKIYNDGTIISDRGFNYSNGQDDTKESVLKFLSEYYIFEEVQN